MGELNFGGGNKKFGGGKSTGGIFPGEGSRGVGNEHIFGWWGELPPSPTTSQ